MNRMEAVLKHMRRKDNAMNRGFLVTFKCPHNYPMIDYFECDGVGLREEHSEYDICSQCWIEEIDKNEEN